MNASNQNLDGQDDTRVDRKDEIDLRELFTVIWNGKWLILPVTILFTVVAVFYSLSLPNTYRAEALIAPAATDESSGLGALAAQYGGLASIGGITLNGSGGVDTTEFALEVIQSRKFISEFVDSHDILISLMASEGWDESQNTLNIDPKIYDLEKEEWVREAVGRRSARPSALEAYEAFRDIFHVNETQNKGFYEVSIEHYSPHIAKDWVDWMVQDLNEALRKRDISESERSIVYLTDQLDTTPLADLQAVFYELIEEQTQTIMLAKGREEYAFYVVDPAVVPEKKHSPSRALICMLAFMFAIVFSVLVLFVYHTSTKLFR